MTPFKINIGDCIVPTCKKPQCAKHLCKMHYTRLCRRGTLNSSCNRLFWNNPDEIRSVMLSKREVDKSGCWIWQGGKTDCNYGHICIEGAHLYVHRVSAMLSGLLDKKSRLLVCHKCDNPPCFNPDHLFVGTHKANTADMLRKGRGSRLTGVDCHKAKLSPLDLVEIVRLVSDGLSKSQIARRFGVSHNTVSSFISGRSYAEQPRSVIWSLVGPREEYGNPMLHD